MRLRRGIWVSITVATTSVLLLGSATAASAKIGFDQITVTGPGLDLDGSVHLRPDRDHFLDMMLVVEHSGFYRQLACRRCASRMTVPWPEDLGPRYVLMYSMPSSFGPNEEVRTRDLIVQYVYPYAEPSPVTFMPSHQDSPGGVSSVGGWFVADQALTRELEVFGAQAPGDDDVSAAQGDQEAGAQLVTVSRLLVVGVVLVIVTSLVVSQRRRRDLSQPRSITFEARQD
jgi:hypothetical protein